MAYMITLNSKVNMGKRSAAEQVDYLEELLVNTQSSLSKMVWMKMTGTVGNN